LLDASSAYAEASVFGLFCLSCMIGILSVIVSFEQQRFPYLEMERI